LPQEVAVLVDDIQEAGYKTVTFNGKDLSSGVYFFHLISGKFNEMKKMVLVR